jgi:prepilin-type N-terminal cleavage/methylation domain-containing protein
MSARALRSLRTAGFTMLELMVAIAVIAVLSAVLLPFIVGAVERARASSARGSLQELAYNMKRVYRDSGYWPYENSIWSTTPNWPYPQVDPRPFNTGDTAMMAPTPPPALTPPGGTPIQLPSCAAVPPGASCWNAPYMTQGGGSLGNTLDPWGNPFYYTYVRPPDGWGGGVSTAPNGFILIWSIGPDGVDETGCTNGPCEVNYSLLAQGKSSLPFCGDPGANAPPNCSDDIVQYVAAAQGDVSVLNPFSGQTQ